MATWQIIVLYGIVLAVGIVLGFVGGLRLEALRDAWAVFDDARVVTVRRSDFYSRPWFQVEGANVVGCGPTVPEAYARWRDALESVEKLKAGTIDASST